MNAIEIKNLHKTYRSLRKTQTVRALRGVSLDIHKGEIFGLLGPNGAGKTTLVKILLGICHASAGSASILGHLVPAAASRKRVGFLPEDLAFPRYMNARLALTTFGRIMCVPNLAKAVEKCLETAGMKQWAGRKIHSYSRGMKRRVGVVLALLNDPDVVFLDEPTEGLDPMGRRYVRDLLLYKKNQGKTIFLNSHILSEVEMICDRVGILNKGRLVRVGAVDELTGAGAHYRIVVGRLDKALDAGLSSLVRGYSRDDHAITFTARDEAELDGVVDCIRSMGVGLRELVRLKDTLEDVFMRTISGENQSDPPGNN